MTASGTGTPQVGVIGEGVHRFAGPRLQQWSLSSGRDAFTDLGYVWRGKPTAAMLDAIAIADHIAIVFLTSQASDQPGIDALLLSAAGPLWAGSRGPTAWTGSRTMSSSPHT